VLRFANQRIGRSDLAAGEAEGAARAFRAAIEADVFHPAAYYGLAQASAVLGDKAAAVSALKKAFSLRENLSPVDDPLPDPSKDTAFEKWAQDKEWKETLAGLG
jgi:tetratricopeptide (TPR) repeat protein